MPLIENLTRSTLANRFLIEVGPYRDTSWLPIGDTALVSIINSHLRLPENDFPILQDCGSDSILCMRKMDEKSDNEEYVFVQYKTFIPTSIREKFKLQELHIFTSLSDFADAVSVVKYLEAGNKRLKLNL